MKATYFFTPDMLELISALEQGQKEPARRLIEQGILLNAYGKEGITPLFWLLMQKNIKGVKLAIKMGADPNLPDLSGNTPVATAIAAEDEEALLILLEGGGDPNSLDRNGEPALFSAISQERIDLIDLLIRFNADIDLKDRTGAGGALYASDLNRYEMVFNLIERGADYTVRDASGGDIAWNVHQGLTKNLLDTEFPAYRWALKVKQQLANRGITFPPPSPREVRWAEDRPNKLDIEARNKEINNRD